MSTPDWWQFVLLATAAFRSWRLLAEDTILDRPRKGLVRLDPDWQDGDLITIGYRVALAHFLTCAWCLGAWVAAGWWVAWLITPNWTTGISVPFALSAVVGLVAKNLDAE